MNGNRNSGSPIGGSEASAGKWTTIMRSRFFRRAVLICALAASLSATKTFAAVSDYKFELANAHAAGPGRTDVTLLLTHKPDDKPVAGAIIYLSRAVMAGMENMPGTATVEPGTRPGTYLLHVTTSMAGTWTLQLSAKLQGEAATLRASVPFQAAE